MRLNAISFLILLISADAVFANVLWSPTGSVPPRHRNITREDAAPCGVGDRGNPTQHFAGETIEVFWDEIIPQNGHFEIYFSAAEDSDWVLVKRIENQNVDSTQTYVGHKVKIDLPNNICESCTLQVVQTITTGVEAKYFSCADIKLVQNPNPNPTQQELPKDICPK